MFESESILRERADTGGWRMNGGRSKVNFGGARRDV